MVSKLWKLKKAQKRRIKMINKENQKLLDEIKTKLTRNKEIDVPFLKAELNVYRLMKNDEMVMAITQLLFNYLPPEEKAKYDLKAHEVLNNRKEQYLKSSRLINEGRLVEAEVILQELVKTYEHFLQVNINNFYDFDQMIEYIIFCETPEKAKKLNVKRYPEPVTYYYYQLATINVETHNLDKAIEYLEKALIHNPRAEYVMQELANLYFETAQDNKFITLSKQILNYAYTRDQFANAYQKLGLYYKNHAKYDIAIACLIVSDHYSKEPINKNLVSEIVKISGYIKFSSPDDILNIFKREDLTYGPSRTVISTINSFINYLNQIKDFKGVEYLLTIAVELTGADYYREQLKELKKIEEK